MTDQRTNDIGEWIINLGPCYDGGEARNVYAVLMPDNSWGYTYRRANAATFATKEIAERFAGNAYGANSGGKAERI